MCVHNLIIAAPFVRMYSNRICMCVQWDLFIKDTLGPAILSTVERLSTLQR